MRKISVLFFLLFATYSVAQTESFQKQINKQVWKPFIKAFNERDQQGFRSVHSPEMVRVLRDKDKIIGFDEYFRERPDSIQQKQRQWERMLELRFIERIASEDSAFEVGYYKTTATHVSTGEERTFYGKFHVLLRKENGVWKILMDADAQQDINESIFQSAEAVSEK